MKINLLTICTLLTFNVNAQFKTIPSSGNLSNESIKINNIDIKPDLNNRFENAVIDNITPVSSLNGLQKSQKIFISDRLEVSLKNESLLSQANRLLNDLVKDGSFKLLSQESDELGYSHLKFLQTFKDLPVIGSEVIYHKKGDNFTINGDIFISKLKVNTTPNITFEEAINLAYTNIGGKPNDLSFSTGLVDKIELTLSIDGNREKLVYEGFAYNNKLDKYYIIVDAHTGKVTKTLAMCKLHNHSHSKSHSNVQPPEVGQGTDLAGNTVSINSYRLNDTYYLIDASRSMFDSNRSNMPNEPIGAIMTIDAFNTSPQNSNFNFDHIKSSNRSFSNKPTAISAHSNAGKSYEYFNEVHGRNSINGNGGTIFSIVNVADEDGSSLGNAFWNGKAIFYGNGGNTFKPLALALDVAGHELTHGVISNTANLRYQNESGALNESFADIFGVMIERENWTIGEEVVKSQYFPSGALRNLADPNNGASKNDYNKGYQPKHYNDRYTGSGDNGGVHINSGIPNYAFYLIANNDKVGLQKAEKIFYRALTRYLTSSSNFAQCRSAVVQSAKDLNYSNEIIDIINDSYNTVGIGSSGTTNPPVVDTSEGSIEVNPGNDLLLITESDQENLYISTTGGELVYNPLTNVKLKSVPSVTDNGRYIVYVDENDSNAKFVEITNSGMSSPENLTSNGIARNVIISKDATKIGLLVNDLVPEIYVYDLQKEQGKTYQLKNPTYTEGLFTENVKYADFIEFSHNGEYIMYDALNEITGQSGNTIEYWDIGMIKVFDNQSNTFASDDQITKLFQGLDEGESIGNPSFAKNNKNIITFDYLNADGDFYLVASNIHTGTANALYQNSDLSYPNYSRDDSKIVFNGTSSGKAVIGQIGVDASKIAVQSDPEVLIETTNFGVKWARWFADGQRDLSTDINEEVIAQTNIYPNPSSNILNIDTDIKGNKSFSLYSISGATVMRGEFNHQSNSIDISHLENGQYLLKVITEEGSLTKVIIKL